MPFTHSLNGCFPLAAYLIMPFRTLASSTLHSAWQLLITPSPLSAVEVRGCGRGKRAKRDLMAYSRVPTGNMISDVGALALRSILGRSQVVLALEYVVVL